MLNTLLLSHLIIAILLIILILSQKTNTDSLHYFNKNNFFSNINILSTYISKIIWALIILFLINSIILSNISTKEYSEIKILEKFYQ